MKDIDEIRRRNIRTLEASVGSAAEYAKRLKMSDSQYANLRDGAKDSKTGKPRGMRKETANRFCKVAGKPIGWLDQDHSSEDEPFSEFALEAAQIMEGLPADKQVEMLHALRWEKRKLEIQQEVLASEDPVERGRITPEPAAHHDGQ